MKAAPRNIERVEDWPKPIFHHVVARRRPVVSGSKQPTLRVSSPDRVVLPQNVCERIRQSHRRCTRLALCGLHFSVPRRAADVNALVMEVNIRPLQAERFARTQSCKRQHDKERAPRFVCERENRFDLGTGEMCGNVDISFGEYMLAKRYLPARISQFLAVASIDESVVRIFSTVFLDAPASWLTNTCWFSGPTWSRRSFPSCGRM